MKRALVLLMLGSPMELGMAPEWTILLLLSSSTIDKKLKNFEFIFKFKIAINFEFNFEIFVNFELNFEFFVNFEVFFVNFEFFC